MPIDKYLLVQLTENTIKSLAHFNKTHPNRLNTARRMAGAPTQPEKPPCFTSRAASVQGSRRSSIWC